MSVEIISKVWEQSQHSGAKLLVMLALANRCSPEGFCFPGYDDIAAKCRIKRRYAIRLVQQIESSGELFVDHRPGRTKSNRYLVTLGLTADEIQTRLVKLFDFTIDEARQYAADVIAKRDGDDLKGVQVDTFSIRNKGVPQDTFSEIKGVQTDLKGVPQGHKRCTDDHPNRKEPSKEPPIRDGGEKPPPPNALEIYESVFQFNVPKNMRKMVLEKIKDDIDALRLWNDICVTWKMRGYGPKNFENLFDRFDKGGFDGQAKTSEGQRSTNGKAGGIGNRGQGAGRTNRSRQTELSRADVQQRNQIAAIGGIVGGSD